MSPACCPGCHPPAAPYVIRPLPRMSPVCCPVCHPERSEGSSATGTQMLRRVDPERSECAQHDSQDSGQGSPSPLTGEVLSSNVWEFVALVADVAIVIGVKRSTS